MSIEHVKQIVGRAVLDEQYRALLFNQPQQALQGFNLTGEELNALQNLTPEKLNALQANLFENMGGNQFVKIDVQEGVHFNPKEFTLDKPNADSFQKPDSFVKGEDQAVKLQDFQYKENNFVKGESLIKFEPVLSSANQLSKVEVRGYDPQHKKEIVGVQGPQSGALGKSGGGVLGILIGLLLFLVLLLFLFSVMPSSLTFQLFGAMGVDAASLGDGSVIPACDGSVIPSPEGAEGPSPHMLPAVQNLFLMMNNFQMQLGQQPMMCKSSYSGSSGIGGAGVCGDQCSTGEWCVASNPGGCAIYCQDADMDGTCEGYRCVDANADHTCDLISWTTCSDAPPGVVCSSGAPQGTCAPGLACSPNAAGAYECTGTTCEPSANNCSPTTCGDQKCDPTCENGNTCPQDCPTPVPPTGNNCSQTACGDGKCDPNCETGTTCAADCAPPADPADPCKDHGGGRQFEGDVCVCPGIMDHVIICADGTKFDNPTTVQCTPNESCEAPPTTQEPPPEEPACRCVLMDPCKTSASTVAGSCPGYYDSCTGAKCSP